MQTQHSIYGSAISQLASKTLPKLKMVLRAGGIPLLRHNALQPSRCLVHHGGPQDVHRAVMSALWPYSSWISWIPQPCTIGGMRKSRLTPFPLYRATGACGSCKSNGKDFVLPSSAFISITNKRMALAAVPSSDSASSSVTTTSG